MRRVAVTGLGVVSGFGVGLNPFWQGISHGVCAIRPLSQVPYMELRITTGVEVPEFQPQQYLDASQVLLGDRNAQFALIAARQAVQQAGLRLPADAAIVTGCCVGGKVAEEAGYWDIYHESRPRVHPLTIPRVMANSGASLIAMDHGVSGPTFTVSTACSSANHAIGNALWLIRNGVTTVALAGGSESPFVYGLLRAWEAMRVVSPDVCRPFSKDRKGMSLGEGAGMLVLEEMEHARARGATILAELAGFGMSADALHITQPSPEGAAKAMRMALADAHLAPEQIGYINAHGTGTMANDPTETAAIKLAFGTHASRLALSSTKSMHGHALGAAGAIEAVAAVMALHHGVLPPTANYLTPDSECDLDVIPNQARAQQVEALLSNSFAFGGLNAVLAFRAANLL